MKKWELDKCNRNTCYRLERNCSSKTSRGVDMEIEGGLFDNYAIGYFEWNEKRTKWRVVKKNFETLEEAETFYNKNLKHCHQKTLYKIPKTDEEIEQWNKYMYGFIIKQESSTVGFI